MLTIFVGTFDRSETLMRTVLSFRRFTMPYRLVIVDNGSDDPAALATLERLEGMPEVARVYPLGKVGSMDELASHFSRAMAQEYRRDHVDEWFAVSDADICFEGTSRLAFDVYIGLARALGRVVGPHLRVDPALPTGYPLRSRVLATEARITRRDAMNWYDDIVPYSPQPIDTTFHVFPATPTFRRLRMNTVRVGPPYDAMHLDWYVDVDNPTAENHAYIQRVSGQGGPPGSWGRQWLADYWLTYQEDPEDAFAKLLHAKRDGRDLCNTSFMLSWALQFGKGVEVDVEQSRRWLFAAIPTRFADFWKTRDDWVAMIYDNDFSSLGWGPRTEVAA